MLPLLGIKSYCIVDYIANEEYRMAQMCSSCAEMPFHDDKCPCLCHQQIHVRCAKCGAYLGELNSLDRLCCRGKSVCHHGLCARCSASLGDRANGPPRDEDVWYPSLAASSARPF